jgi:hypothetical protein
VAASSQSDENCPMAAIDESRRSKSEFPEIEKRPTAISSQAAVQVLEFVL